MPFIRIRKHYLHIPYLVLGLVEFALLVAAVFLSVEIERFFKPNAVIHDVTIDSAILFAFILSCTTLAMGVYISLVREGYASMVLRTLVSFCLLSSIALRIIYMPLPALALDSSISFWAIVFSMLFVFATRFLFIVIVDAKQLRRHAIIYGAGESARLLFEEHKADLNSMAVRILGCVNDNASDIKVDSKYILEKPDNWLTFCKSQKITEIIIAPDERRRSQGSNFPLDELLACKLGGIEITDALSFYERELAKIKLSLLKPSWMLFSDGFAVSRGRDWSKRLVDITISLTLLAFLWPFIILTALAVMIETGRPVLYHQTRVGANGKPFKIFKFRSMRQDAEKGGKAIWAQKNDSRITRVGGFIRNTRLDELPQLYNVIKGEMSFVGPRPERPEFVEELKEKIPFYDMRHQVKPGLMGWAQLKYPYGASVDDARNKLEYDLYYTKNHSQLMDILIMIQTVEVVLLGKGVH